MFEYQDYEELKQYKKKLQRDGIWDSLDLEIKNIYDNNLKYLERYTRCRDENGVRCKEKCSECPKERDGDTFSTEYLYEEKGYELISDFSTEEHALRQISQKTLRSTIKKLESRDQTIMQLYGVGFSEREISDQTGIKKSTVNYRKKSTINKLKNLLKNF